ncbi:MAG: hypothetical protein RIR97_561 [Pseudomonadota bacterium]
MPIDRVIEIAPAKINLALHVTGQRSDGFHKLETIVTFADRGDHLTLEASDVDGFDLTGRFSPSLTSQMAPGTDNLVLKARDLIRRDLAQRGIAAPPVRISLEKNLPIAAGLGGGSADAAAVLRGLARLWRADLSASGRMSLARSLGADVPMCLAGRPLLARGIGEEIDFLPHFPTLSLVLANPLQPVSTPAAFRLLTQKSNAGLTLPDMTLDRAQWLAQLALLRNDLEAPARQLVPEIALISDLLRDAGANLVRMSGSGATCFGIFASDEVAEQAAEALSRLRPNWYFAAVKTRAGDAYVAH